MLQLGLKSKLYCNLVPKGLIQFYVSLVKAMKPEFSLSLNVNVDQEWHSNTTWHFFSEPSLSTPDKNKDKKASKTEPPYYNPNLTMKVNIS